MKIKSILKIFSIVFLSLTLLNAFQQLHNTNYNGNKLSETNMKLGPEGMKELKKYMITLYILKHYYVNDYNYSELIQKSIKGLLNNLDPHTTYLDKKEFKELKNSSDGKYVGVGMVVEKTKDNQIKIIKVFDKGPAAKAGIKANDILIKVNGKIIEKDTSLNEVVNKVKGKEGTNVKLTVYRLSDKKFYTFNIKRAKIKIPTVVRKYIKGNEDILYVKINQFNQVEFKELKKIIDKYMHNEKIKRKGIIIDLRNNPGGLLSSAIKTLDIFIPKGKLLIVKGRNKDKEIYKAHEKNTYKNVPIVVLVNENSASAAEVVSGVLKYYKRAVIVGQKTFGKGSVQIILPYKKVLNDNSEDALKLTIAKYYLPNNKSIQGEGITPDILVKQKEIKDLNNTGITITENSLDNSQLIHINKNEKYKEIENKYNIKIKNKDKILDPNKDFQLYNAVNVLRTIEVINYSH